MNSLFKEKCSIYKLERIKVCSMLQPIGILKNETIQFQAYEFQVVKNLPQQNNGYDCGLFVFNYVKYFVEKKSRSFRTPFEL